MIQKLKTGYKKNSTGGKVLIWIGVANVAVATFALALTGAAVATGMKPEDLKASK